MAGGGGGGSKRQRRGLAHARNGLRLVGRRDQGIELLENLLPLVGALLIEGGPLLGDLGERGDQRDASHVEGGGELVDGLEVRQVQLGRLLLATVGLLLPLGAQLVLGLLRGPELLGVYLAARLLLLELRERSLDGLEVLGVGRVYGARGGRRGHDLLGLLVLALLLGDGGRSRHGRGLANDLLGRLELLVRGRRAAI